jgi:hypothetical protein
VFNDWMQVGYIKLLCQVQEREIALLEFWNNELKLVLQWFTVENSIVSKIIWLCIDVNEKKICQLGNDVHWENRNDGWKYKRWTYWGRDKRREKN